MAVEPRAKGTSGVSGRSAHVRSAVTSSMRWASCGATRTSVTAGQTDEHVSAHMDGQHRSCRTPRPCRHDTNTCQRLAKSVLTFSYVDRSLLLLRPQRIFSAGGMGGRRGAKCKPGCVPGGLFSGCYCWRGECPTPKGTGVASETQMQTKQRTQLKGRQRLRGTV